jgi:hypothetical protein
MPATVAPAGQGPTEWQPDAPAAQAAPIPVVVCCGAVAVADDVPDDRDVPSFPIRLVTHLEAAALPQAEAGEEGVPAFQIQLEPPGRQRLYRLESEAGFRERIRQETPRRPHQPVIFPPEPDIAEGVYERHWPGRVQTVEPHYLCYKPLFYEQVNFERYGWDLGVLSPFLSGAAFYCDLLLAPYHALANPSPCYDCSAGYCLPGDPVPLLLYPPHWPISVEINGCPPGFN